MICLCGCFEVDHALGEGICAGCGCPAFRPAQYSPADELNDRQHDGVADELLQVHGLEIEVTGDQAWVLLPDLELTWTVPVPVCEFCQAGKCEDCLGDGFMPTPCRHGCRGAGRG